MGNKTARTTSLFSPLPRSFKIKIALIWVKRNTAVYGPLSINVLREVCLYLPRHPLLACCDSSRVVQFDLAAKSFRVSECHESKSPLNYICPCECVYIEDEKFLLCGGRAIDGSCTNASFLLDRGRCVRLRGMREARCDHGLCYNEFSRSVFAFGGQREPYIFKSCEQYNLDSNSWYALPDMARQSMDSTTCSYQKKVYICSGTFASIQVFDIPLKEFTTLPITNPLHWGPTALTVWNERLVMCCGDSVRMVDINTCALVVDSTLPYKIMFGRNNAVLCGTLFSMEFHTCVSLDLDTFMVNFYYFQEKTKEAALDIKVKKK